MPLVTSTDALSIGTLRTTMFVSSEHPDPERVLRDVRSALVVGLGAAVSARLSATAATSRAVWRVRRLQVDTDVNAAWDGDRIADAVASALVRSLARELVGSGDGVNAIRFETAAAHLAQYLVDRVEGAERRWYHKRFDGLALLPSSAALRTAIARDAADGLAALQQLQPDARRRVIDTLSAIDARHVLMAFASLPARATVADACAAAARLEWPGARPRSVDAAALSLFLELAGDRLGGQPLRQAVELIAQLADRVARLSLADRDTLAEDLARGDMSIARQLVAEMPAASSLTPEAAAAVVRSLDGRPAVDFAEPNRAWTRFGGVFLLLPDVDAEAFGESPLRFADDEAANTRCLACLAASLALEGAWSGALESDAVIRDLFAIPPSADMAGVWATALEADRSAVVAAAEQILGRFARRLPGFAASPPEHLRRNFLDACASVEREPSRIVVRLARPPLHVLLSMTGLMRRTYTLPWLADVPVELFPQE